MWMHVYESHLAPLFSQGVILGHEVRDHVLVMKNFASLFLSSSLSVFVFW